jgi:hypothetical protein
MSERLNRFLGDTPLRVAMRLAALSFIVGLVLSALDIRPVQVLLWIERSVGRIYAQGFAVLRDAAEYLLVGALIVVPLFFLVRLLKLGAWRRGE